METLRAWLAEERGRALRLAKHLDVPQSSVSTWVRDEEPVPVPVVHGAAIEAFTGGAVLRRDMFPDRWQRIWPELAAAQAANDATSTHPQPLAAAE